MRIRHGSATVTGNLPPLATVIRSREGGGRDDPEVRILHRGLELHSPLKGVSSGLNLRGFISRRRYFLFQVLLLISAVSQTALSISDTAGFPVIAASVFSDSIMIGITDSEGTVLLTSEPDSIEVHVIGYNTWQGPMPPSGHLVLVSVPVPSGVVISVTASRRGFRDRFPSTTVLNRHDIEFIASAGLRSLNSRCSGIYVREYGGAMPVISVSLRGSDPGHSGYYVDGHDIGSSMDGLPGLTLNPIVFSGVEIARGGGSGFLKGGIAGALNFLPESTELPSRASLSISNEGALSVSCGITTGRNRLGLSVRRLVGIESTVAHDGVVLFNGSTDGFRYGFMAAASGGETESPDWSPPTDGIRQRYSFDGWIRWILNNYTLSSDFRTGRHIYSSTTPTVIDDTHDELRGSVTVECGMPFMCFETHLAGRTVFEQVWSTSLGERDRLTGDLSFSSGYTDAISITGSTRLNIISKGDTKFGAVLSAGAPVFDSLFIIHASGSRGFRRPTINDLYWPEDTFARGNPDLKSENSLETEIGLSLIGCEFMKLSTTGFLAITDDLIRWEPGSDGKWSPVNISEALRKGIETEVLFRYRSLTVRGSFTLLSVTDDSPESTNYGSVLPYTPDYTFGVESGLDIFSGIRCSVSLSGMGIRFKNYSETSWLPAYSIISAGLDMPLPFTSNFSIGTSVDNMFDEEYQETSGFRGKPRTFSFTIKWSGHALSGACPGK